MGSGVVRTAAFQQETVRKVAAGGRPGGWTLVAKAQRRLSGRMEMFCSLIVVVNTFVQSH